MWLASGTVHKKTELAAILDREVKIPADAGLDFEPEETGGSFLENALLKARELYRLLGEKGIFSAEDAAVISDDSGLSVDALGGRPGIFSARYAGAGIAPNEKKLSDRERNTLLLAELGDNPRRSARFVCAMALLFSADRFFLVQETLEGEIVISPEFAKGSGGFGYDPILYIPPLGRTVAELSEEEKNSVSHRGKAGKAVAKLLAGG
jgi:XTP/dITP diphosphohydrolase